MATMRAEFLGKSLSTAAAPSVRNANRSAASLKVVSVFKKKAAAAAAPVKKAAKTVQKAASKVIKPDNEELAKWYGTYLPVRIDGRPPSFLLKFLILNYVA